MNRIHGIILLVLLIVFWQDVTAQTQRYHQYEPTASGYALIKWNIDKDSIGTYYILEKSDEKNRVKSIQFMKNDGIDAPSLCYVSPWIVFEYPNDSVIIEYRLNSDSTPMVEWPCESGYKVVYQLTGSNRIKSSTVYYFEDSNMLKLNHISDSAISKIIELHMVPVKGVSDDCFIGGYIWSYFKYNRIFPCGTNFSLEDMGFWEEERADILATMK